MNSRSDRNSGEFSHLSEELKQAIREALAAAANHLWDSFNRFGAAIREMQQALKELQEFREMDEHPVKTKPLRLRDQPSALPLKHQVLNRKPVMQVARSRC